MPTRTERPGPGRSSPINLASSGPLSTRPSSPCPFVPLFPAQTGGERQQGLQLLGFNAGPLRPAVRGANDGGGIGVKNATLGGCPLSSHFSARVMTLLRDVSVLLVLSLGLMGCVSSSTTQQSGLSSNRIVVGELPASVNGLSAYEIVKRYRSNWLEKRGPSSFKSPVTIKVYLDGATTPYGPAEALRQVRMTNVVSIRYFNAQEAQFKFGLGNVAGAILVRTRPRDE